MNRAIIFAVSLCACILAGCAGTGTGTVTLTARENDALLVDQAFIQIANLIAATPNEPAAAVSVAKSLTNGVDKPLDVTQTALKALIAGTAPPTAVPTFPAALGQLDSTLADLAPIAATYSPAVGSAMIAAEILLTTAEKIAAGTPTSQARVAHAASSTMTADQARQNLLAFTAARKPR